MTDVLRTCRRTGCRWPAVASLTFRYATREVWLEGLPDEAHPAAYDLCPHHAETLTVPRGWELIDRRESAAPPREPAGRDLPAVEAGPDEVGAGARGRARAAVPGAATPNRYAALSADLPRLAAEHAAAESGVDREGGSGPELPEEIEGQLAMPVAVEVGAGLTN